MERHQIIVRAPVANVYAAVRELDIGRAKVTRLLFKLRGLPATSTISMKDFLRLRFTVLGEKEGQEFVLGLVGKFWSPTGGLRRVQADEFNGFDQRGYAKAVWNFSLREQPGGNVVLSTETRVRCTDPKTRRRFRLYWAFIGTFSGCIRRDILRSLKQNAEQGIAINRV